MAANVTISDEQMEKIKAISEQTGVAADDFVREAIDRMVVEKDPKTSEWKVALRPVTGIWEDRDVLEETSKSFRDGFENRHAKLFPSG